jgi:ABC-type spermidine/putrescine transport system permease subunit II
MKQPNRFVTIIYWLVIAYLYCPLLNLIAQAFLEKPHDWSSGLTLKWIEKLTRNDVFWRPLFTSIEIAVLSATIAVTVGTLGAVGFARRKKPLSYSLQTLIMLPILLPEVITGLSLLLFFLIVRVELGLVTVVIAHASFSASFAYFIIAEQLRKIDPSVEEAAEDLGAKPSQIFWKITLPNIVPGLMGGWLLAFTLSFDDFLISFFTSGAGLTTLPLKIYSMMRIGISPEVNALSCVMILISFSLVMALVSKQQGREWVLKSS